ncbi:MAG: isopentenyl phosphate kinase, partial [Candidatus Bathyarchaeia archaeon]
MSQAKPTILKIGGSVITDKSKEMSVRMDIISRLADEILEADPKSLIIVHGGGSFGHPVAQKYAIKEGFKDPSQIIGFAETHHVMTVLNGLFMDALIWRGIPAVSITPSSCILTKNGRIACFEDALLKRLLEMGFIPVLYGDAVLDTELGFTILSGDQITAFLALRLNAKNVVIGVDVDGLYDQDPKINAEA